MIKGKSKIIMAGYVAFVCAVAGCGGTAAYLTHQAAAANEFVVGSQVSSVDETWSPPESLEKGKTYTKEVRVANTGTVACYVRVLAEPSEQSTSDAVTIDWNQQHWTAKQSDGYYYYKSILPAGEKTEPLFTKVTATENLSDFELIVYEETVQAAGLSSPQDAFGS